MADEVGEADLRAETISRIVKGFALASYKMKSFCMIESSSAWTETYYRETAADLVKTTTTGITEESLDHTPRFAKFNNVDVSWTKVSGRNTKHTAESTISWEDERTNNVPVVSRTLLRIGRAITKSVDVVIAAKILSEAGQTQTANATWNNATISDRDPIQDILNAKSKIAIANYDPDKNGFLLLHPTNYAEALGNANIRNAGQFYTDSVTRNGVVGRALGLTWIVSNSVAEGGAQIIISKEALTWKSVVALTVHTINDPLIKKTIRAVEVGQLQVVNPDAICKITGI